MLKVYFDYPNARVSVHHDPNCSRIQVMHKLDQRQCRIDIASISAELQKFRSKEYRFASKPALNDMWLEVDFQDEEFEMAVLSHIRRLLGQHYKSFSDSSLEIHC